MNVVALAPRRRPPPPPSTPRITTIVRGDHNVVFGANDDALFVDAYLRPWETRFQRTK